VDFFSEDLKKAMACCGCGYLMAVRGGVERVRSKNGLF
jgi:hypothetical protein